MFRTHVCLVSRQAAPNLLPLLDDELKPDQVILLVTEQMGEQAKYLQEAIRSMDIRVRLEPFSAVGDFDELQTQLIELLNGFQAEEIALNATGGTKWMAIAAQEVFRMNGSPVFYVDIDTGSVLFLDSQRSSLILCNRIKMEQYLRAYGYTIINNGNNSTQIKGLKQAQRELCQHLVAKVAEWGNALGQLNKLASEAESRNSLHVPMDFPLNPNLEKLLKECACANVLNYHNANINFINEEARFFANGGWLEEYINSKLNKLKSDNVLQDSSRLNLKIQSPGKAENEIDIAFMANNRLHLVECKTRRFTGSKAGSAGTDSLYKLDSIRDLGGLGTKSMLVSYRPLGSADAQRAKDLKIAVVQGEDIHNMDRALRNWINNTVG